MPKLPEKYEDWTAPWGDGEIDPDKAGRLLFNALTNVEKLKVDKSDLRDKLSESETKVADLEAAATAKPGDEGAKDAQITELTRKVQKLEKDGRTQDQDLLRRYEAAMEHGLTAKDAKRLVGDSLDELLEDAAELAERLGTGKKDDEGDGDGGTPPRRLPGDGELGNGRRRRDEEPAVKSVDELRKEKREGQISLPPLSR